MRWTGGAPPSLPPSLPYLLIKGDLDLVRLVVLVQLVLHALEGPLIPRRHLLGSAFLGLREGREGGREGGRDI